MAEDKTSKPEKAKEAVLPGKNDGLFPIGEKIEKRDRPKDVADTFEAPPVPKEPEKK